MTLRKWFIGTALASIVLVPALALAVGPEQSAEQLFAKGNELLQKVDLNGALRAYAAAAKADGTKVEYRQQYSILRQVITLRSPAPARPRPSDSPARRTGRRATGTAR